MSEVELPHFLAVYLGSEEEAQVMGRADNDSTAKWQLLTGVWGAEGPMFLEPRLWGTF